MQTQTGPVRGQTMRSWLIWTGAGELVSVVVFTVLVGAFIRGRDGPWTFTLLGLLLLNLMLLQGGMYWLVKVRHSHGRFSPRSRLQLLRGLYAVNALALSTFPIAVVLTLLLAPATIHASDLLAGLALYLFAAGEFVHYFLFKINMRPREWRAILSRRRPLPARFRRELRRAESAVQPREHRLPA